MSQPVRAHVQLRIAEPSVGCDERFGRRRLGRQALEPLRDRLGRGLGRRRGERRGDRFGSAEGQIEDHCVGVRGPTGDDAGEGLRKQVGGARLDERRDDAKLGAAGLASVEPDELDEKRGGRGAEGLDPRRVGHVDRGEADPARLRSVCKHRRVCGVLPLDEHGARPADPVDELDDRRRLLDGGGERKDLGVRPDGRLELGVRAAVQNGADQDRLLAGDAGETGVPAGLDERRRGGAGCVRGPADGLGVEGDDDRADETRRRGASWRKRQCGRRGQSRRLDRLPR